MEGLSKTGGKSSQSCPPNRKKTPNQQQNPQHEMKTNPTTKTKTHIPPEFRAASIFGCTESPSIPRFTPDLGVKYYCLQVDFQVLDFKVLPKHVIVREEQIRGGKKPHALY